MRYCIRLVLTPLAGLGSRSYKPLKSSSFRKCEIILVDLSQYLPILLFLGVALLLSSAFVVLPMIAAKFTGADQPNPQKLAEYECGFPAFEDSRAQFDVRFYLVAILFIIFDLEAAFLYPWAVALGGIGFAGWAAMMLFLVELGLGFVYAWKKGALEWE